MSVYVKIMFAFRVRSFFSSECEKQESKIIQVASF